jgi:hypothetical protein
MVVSLDIYELLSVLGLILCIAYLVFLFVGREKIYIKVIRLICAFALVVIYTFKIPMDISMGNSYGNTIFTVILWLVNVVFSSMKLGDDL